VAATSPTNAWAVGFYDNGGLKTLILHWDGTSWTVQPSPNVSVGGNLSQLLGVAATSSSDAWAVGYYENGVALQTLIERWDGTTWKVQPSPNVGGSDNKNELLGVASTSETNVWAVGKYRTRRGNHTLLERWDGTTWKVQPSPNPGRFNQLSGVSATSSTNAWAVGFYHNGGVPVHTLAEHWNGTAWTVRPSPNPGSEYNYLDGVAATSSTNAWAVGYFNNFGGLDRTIALHWNGTAWGP
jgi:erythromycin esterase-like protein